MDAYYRGLWNLLAVHDADDADPRAQPHPRRRRRSFSDAIIAAVAPAADARPGGRARRALRRRRGLPQLGAVDRALAGDCDALRARSRDARALPIDFLFLLATLAGVGSIWQFGFSGSAPLLVATPGHFLEKTTGVMPLTTTIWSPAAMILVLSFTVAVMVVGCVLMPRAVRPVSMFVKDEPVPAMRGPNWRRRPTDLTADWRSGSSTRGW